MKRLIVLLALVGLLAACGPAAATPTTGAAPTAAATQGVSPTAAATQPAAGSGELVVWDQFNRATEKELVDTLNSEFEAAHSGVKIDRVVKSFDDLKVTIKLALSDPSGPDIGQVNQGADMRATVQGNLLADLTPYVSKYGWDTLFSSSLLARNSFSADGQNFGTGNLYGVSVTGEVVGVYYNKDKFQQLGLTIPQTFDEFQAMLAKIKQAGETPITFGNVDGGEGIQIYMEIEQAHLADRTWLDDFVYGRNNVSFNIPENVQAAQIMVDWAKAGYFTQGYEGISDADAGKAFATGQGVLFLGGSWWSPDITAAGGEKFGFFVMPKASGALGMAQGGVGLPFSVRAGSKQQDLAAEYINWMTSSRAAELWLSKGVLPAMPVDPAKIPQNTLLGDIATSYGALVKANAMGHYLDWAGPTLYDTFTASIQEVLAGRTTPQDFVNRIQTEYTKK